MTRLAIALVVAATAPVAADPCEDPVVDPVATPLHDAHIDVQRGGCLRSEVSAGLDAHALIDTPGFHGLLGGDLALRGRARVGEDFEVGAFLRVADFAFVQNAVNKATATRFGPVVAEAAWATALAPNARIAIAAALELPGTRDDTATTHVGGQLVAAVTGELGRRWTVHARMGAIGATASSFAGDTQQLALRAGMDAAWHVRPTVALLAGGELMAGWYHGLDTFLVRLGATVRPGRGMWRVATGVGLPMGGGDRTNAVLDVGVVRALD